MRRLFLIVFLIVLSFKMKATPSLFLGEWYDGYVFLKSGERLSGKIQFDWMTDVVLCKYNGTVKAFSPQNVRYFQFFDSNKQENRTFVSYKDFKKAKRGYIFYEVLDKGGTQVVLRRSYRTSNPERILRGGMGQPKYVWKNEDWVISEVEFEVENSN